MGVKPASYLVTEEGEIINTVFIVLPVVKASKQKSLKINLSFTFGEKIWTDVQKYSRLTFKQQREQAFEI